MTLNNIVFCDGGLGNRFSSLFMAALLTEKLSMPWDIAWPRNNWCDAAFLDLFDSQLNVFEVDLTTFSNQSDSHAFIMHENQLGWTDRIIYDQRSVRSFEQLVSLRNTGKPIFYYSNLLPAFININDLVVFKDFFSFKRGLREKAKAFIEEYRIDDSVHGIHIRKTDFGSKVDENRIYGLVKQNSSQRYFICSDSRAVIEMFRPLKNCLTHTSKEYPEMLADTGSWNSPITDNVGRSFPFNVNRSAGCIEGAIVDLILLSKTLIVPTSGSTFARTAEVLKLINFGA